MASIDLGILPACEFVVDNARSVRVEMPVLQSLARQWVDQPFEVPGWDSDIHWSGTPQQTLHYVLLLDALNFCFWVDPEQMRWEVEYQRQSFNGYKALSVALRRALEEGVELTSATTLANLSAPQLAHILRGKGAMADLVFDLSRQLRH